jgi:hypothetical protein
MQLLMNGWRVAALIACVVIVLGWATQGEAYRR